MNEFTTVPKLSDGIKTIELAYLKTQILDYRK